MSHPDFDTMIMLERRRDDLAAAEQSRMVKIALEAQDGKQNRRYSTYPGLVYQSILHLAGQGLYQIGIHIQNWGCQLQVRYAIGAGSSQSAPCD